MPNTDNLCMSCMKPIGDAKQCPYCGYHADSPQLSPYLPIRSVVANRYLVGKVLEFNGDGVTYAGWDMTERIAVKVREFLPDAICSRENGETQVRVMQGCERAYTDCYQSFLELWRKLMRLMGLSALISVTDVVEDNGTAYAIYEYTDAVPLRKYLLSTSTGYIPWERARQMFMPALSALGTLHSAGIIHRGLSPQTILVTPDGKLKISGFSIWQARTARGDLNPELFPGYAAIEQYGFEGQQGAWTDIYAFAAVLSRAHRHRSDSCHDPRYERPSDDTEQIRRAAPGICHKRADKRASDPARGQNPLGRTVQSRALRLPDRGICGRDSGDERRPLGRTRAG